MALKVTLGSEAYGYDLISGEDVQAGFVNTTLGLVITEVMRSEKINSGKPFQYISVKPVAKTHYTLLFVSESVKYNTLILTKITHSDPRTRRSFIKNASIHPAIDTHHLENYEKQFNGASKYLPALVVEVWTKAELDLKALVRVGGTDQVNPDTSAEDLTSGFIRLSGDLSNPENTCKLPPTVVRVIDPAAFNHELSMPIPPSIKASPEAAEQVESIYKILAQLHIDSNDFPKEFRMKRASDSNNNLWQIHAIGFMTEISMEDLASIFFFSMNSILSIYYDCAIVSDCIPRDFYRGGLVISFNLGHNVPSRNPHERLKEYKTTRPSMQFVVPDQVCIPTKDATVPVGFPSPIVLPAVLQAPTPKPSLVKRSSPEKPEGEETNDGGSNDPAYSKRSKTDIKAEERRGFFSYFRRKGPKVDSV